MSVTLQPYVPDLLIHLLQRQRKHMHTHAAALFADVSGFTAMTEAFATHGNAGAEELTGVINRFFEALIKIVGQHGGDIVSFGGDALAIAFRGPPSRRRQLTQLAHHCAIAMQQEAQAYTQVHTRCGSFALSIKIGLSFGALNAQIVEDDTGQARFLVSGDALLWAGQAEQQAGSGEVVRHASVEPIGDTFVPPRTQINVSPTTPKLVEGEEESLQRFIPPALANRVLSGQGTLVNEHRKVTVMFVGMRPRPSRSVITIVHQFDGNVTRLDSGDKGLRVLALFGAPVMHQDDAERATRCALTLLGKLGENVRIGIATGTLFCGDVGAAQRHEYTVMGNAVNIAARLMQHAGWGQALVDEATQAGATASIIWQPLPPLQLKGKSAPTSCFQPIALQDSSKWSQPESLSPHTNTPLIGRAPEQALLLDIVQRAGQGQCQSIVIQGEAGVGKSRLGAYAMMQAHSHAMRVVLAAALPYAQPRYAVVEQLLRALMRLPATSTELRAGVDAWLSQHAPHLQARLALLMLALGQPMQRDTWLGQLDVETRTRMLHEGVWDVLHAQAQPLFICVEDAHGLDEGSREFLKYMVATLARDEGAAEVRTSHRPSRSSTSSTVTLCILTRLTLDIPTTHTLALNALAPDDAQVLVQRTWQQTQLPNTRAARSTQQHIVQRAQGNPLFIEQLVQYARQKDGVLKASDVPGDLRSLLLQRIDQLPAATQTTLKVASVIGPSFKADWIPACWPGTPPIDPQTLHTHMAQLITLDLIVAGANDPWADHRFRHTPLREAAYSTLSFAIRATLHERIGLHIEQVVASDDSPLTRATRGLSPRGEAEAIAKVSEGRVDELLAYHFGQSHNTDKQRVYFRRAGDAASASFANETAIQHYERLLPLLTTQEQAEVRVQLGEVQAHTGQWVQAEAQLRAGLAATSLSLQARAQLALGRLLARSQSYADSIQWLQLARASFSELVDEPRLCNTLTHLSFAQLELGELPAAEETAQQQWRIAQETQDVAGMAEAQQTLGQLCLQRGQLVEAQAHLGQALQLATAQEDPSRSLIIENDIATLAWRMNDYPTAFAHFISALGIADRIGFRAWVGVLLGNIGVLLWELGALDRAAQCQAWALKIALEVGDQSSELTCLGNIASLLRDMHSDLTRPILARAINLGQTLRMPYYLCDHACLATELAFEQGDFIEAERYCALAHEAAQMANDTEVLFRVRVWRGRIDGVQTKAILETALVYKTITSEQAALVYDHIWQLSGVSIDAQRTIDAYAQLFTKTPRHSYKTHVERIASGAGLPLPVLHTPAWVAPLCATPLPELTLIEMDDVDLLQLLKRVQVA